MKRKNKQYSAIITSRSVSHSHHFRTQNMKPLPLPSLSPKPIDRSLTATIFARRP